jgi:spermidine synthase
MNRWYFVFFVVSGFCSILYELVWLRLAMAQFGVTTALVSIVLSIFMIGIGVGSWGAGLLVRKYGDRLGFPALRLYAIAELLIGISALSVPYELLWGRELLLRSLANTSLSSSAYLVLAGTLIATSLIPWCACMGATFPLAMFAVRRTCLADKQHSFSYLYLANILGAMLGATIPLILIEAMGFQGTLRVGALSNFLLASSALGLTFYHPGDNLRSKPSLANEPQSANITGGTAENKLLWFLFGTGLTSMAAEVVWIRLYTTSLGTLVYAFAAILALYLLATYVGSWIYRRKCEYRGFDGGLLWIVLGLSVILPFLTADPMVSLPTGLRVVLGVAPFAGLVGFITPMIMDRFSRGDPDRAGKAYAVNIVGCVLGPLLSGFVLLPFVGERLALCVLALPWFVVGFALSCYQIPTFRSVLRPDSVVFSAILVLGSVELMARAKGFEQQYEPRVVRRDHTATVVATSEGPSGKRLLINGVGITNLTPITKMMAHLPLAFLGRPPVNALVICFGMGTTHRSMLSWDIHSTAVELVPSVPSVFYFFHSDGPELLRSPKSEIVIDDGRFYLERSTAQYDVITIDPPPPVAAAGSSLLYSKEFYSVASKHLRPDGILQQWLPEADPAVTASVFWALQERFRYVRAFGSLEGWGTHFLASNHLIPFTSPSILAHRLPSRAVQDLVEWGPRSTAEEQFEIVLNHEISLNSIAGNYARGSAVTDDRPFNEYFVLRSLRDPMFWRRVERRLFEKNQDF